MKLINGIITIIVVGSVVAFIVLSIFPPNKKYKDTEKHEVIENKKHTNTTTDIDSSKLQIDRLVQQFGCDTTIIGDFLDFTYKLNERLLRGTKTRLFTIMVRDIYRSENDSLLTMYGTILPNSMEEFNMLSFSNKCEFIIKDTEIIKNANKLDFFFCVIANPKLVHLKTYEIETNNDDYIEQKKVSIEDNQSVTITGECIYMEKKL